MLVPVFRGCKQVYESPAITDMQKHLTEEKAKLWPTFKRMINPHVYHVDLSQKLWDIKYQLLDDAGVKRS